MNYEPFQTLGISLGLGLLVGLQRERSDSRIAGIRTFPLVTLLGTVCALLAGNFGGWIVVGGFIAVAAMIATANMVKARLDKPDPGQTSEAALLLMYGLGAYLAVGSRTAAVAIGAAVAVLLHLKEPMHSFARKIGERDIKAVMQFVVISFIILPVLPDATYGPYDVLNPREIWTMVVLIVGIGLSGYVVYKVFGEKAGTLLGGILGGMISSTATTVSYARRARQSPDISSLAALIVVIASTIAFVRVLVEIAVVAPSIVGSVVPPLGVMLGLMVLISTVFFVGNRQREENMPEQGNPAEIRSALVFGGLYALMLLGIAFAKDTMGSGGLYAIAVISGLTDVDAVTLSSARMVESGRVDPSTGWRLILTASMANLAFKGALAGIMGGRRLFLRIGLLFGIALLCGAALLWLWP